VPLFARENNTQARASQGEAEISCRLLLPRLQMQEIQACKDLGMLLIDAFAYERRLLDGPVYEMRLRQIRILRLYRLAQLPRTRKRCREKNRVLPLFFHEIT